MEGNTTSSSSMLGTNVSSGIGAAAYVAIISAIYKRNLKTALGVLGNILVGGAIERALNFTDKVSILSENGTKMVLPMSNLNELQDLPPTVLGETYVPFYGNNQMLMQRRLF